MRASTLVTLLIAWTYHSLSVHREGEIILIMNALTKQYEPIT